ncbi:MAG: hypothetical protein ACR2P2_04920, partial [Nakamurella sp.]
MTARRLLVVAAAGLMLLVAGCDSNVGGSPHSGGLPIVGGSTVAGSSTGTSRWLTNPVLTRLPAGATTMSSISLIDGATMNKIGQRLGFKDSTPDSNERPKSETAWLDVDSVDNPCGQELDSSSGGLRTCSPGESVQIELGPKDAHGYLAICAPAASAGKLSDAKARGTDMTAKTFAGVAGFGGASSEWMGNNSGNTITYIAESDTPAELAEAVIGSKTPPAS